MGKSRGLLEPAVATAKATAAFAELDLKMVAFYICSSLDLDLKWLLYIFFLYSNLTYKPDLQVVIGTLPQNYFVSNY